MLNEKDSMQFANVILSADVTRNIMINKKSYKIEKGEFLNTNYANESFQLLKRRHEYKIHLAKNKSMVIALRLYENINNHYRLFAFSEKGMLFSINLTTKKESKRLIWLTQKIRFSDRISGTKADLRQYRRSKADILAKTLILEGYEVAENNDIILGGFNPVEGTFIDTKPDKFIMDFLKVAIIKGHFMGNKGYTLDVFPKYDHVNCSLEKIGKKIPLKILIEKGKRQIPLGLRYKIFVRDNYRCQICGRSAKDGISLHIDHIKPFSLGGLSESANLRVLCNECNSGRSNKYIK